MLINNKIPHNFGIKIIKIANYFYNRLSIGFKAHKDVIPEEYYIRKK